MVEVVTINNNRRENSYNSLHFILTLLIGFSIAYYLTTIGAPFFGKASFAFLLIFLLFLAYFVVLPLLIILFLYGLGFGIAIKFFESFIGKL